MSTKVLFVCTYWGVRSQIAELFAKAHSLRVPEAELLVESAGFESGTIGELPIELMAERGFELPSSAPPTLFHYSRKDSHYDFVITLCNQYSQENYQVLYDVVDLLFGQRAQILHWSIADFMAIGDVPPDVRKRAGKEIVDAIADSVDEFVLDLPQFARS